MKWKLYQQVLQRFLHITSANRQPVNIPKVENKDESNNKPINENEIEDIVDSLPIAYRNESRALLRTLIKRGADHIRWDDIGTVYVNGIRLSNSNIVDIIHSIVRTRKTSHLPNGWVQVRRVLKDMNEPSTYIGNPAALQFLGRSSTTTSRSPSPPHMPTSLMLTPPDSATPHPSRSRHRQHQQDLRRSRSSIKPFSKWESLR